MTPAEHAATVREALDDARPGPMPEHDAMCRTFSGFPDTGKECNCSVARNLAAFPALEALEAQAEERNRWKFAADEAELELQAAEAERDRLREKLTAESGYCGEVLSERDRLAARVEKLEAALRDHRELLVIDEDGAVEAIEMDKWGPVWVRGSAALDKDTA